MKFFKRYEFNCQCGCGYDTVDYELAEVLDDVRTYFGKACYILSGCRCNDHNKKVGGAETSQHLYGKAADIVIDTVESKLVYNYLNSKYPKTFGLGLYNGWVHIDVRDEKARW